jgi:outer membrane lipoprotein-sorting protein
MHKATKFVFFALIAMLLLAVRASYAAPATPNEKEKDKVLRRLDEAAKNFHSTEADFEFDTIQTDPIYDKDVQKGTVYYERKGTAFQMAAHINTINGKPLEINGKPAPKVYTYSSGIFRLFEPGLNQVTTFSKLNKYESYLMLGFGASGKDLEEKWDIKYLGQDTLMEGKVGVKTEMLELVAKDPEIRKSLPKVTVWIDPERGVSLKQIFDEGPGQYRVSLYFNIKVNQPLPADAFTLKTNKQTVYVSR